MAASPLDGLYWAYSIPLGLYNLIQSVLGQTQNDPNTPRSQTNTAPRDWFSQPRPATGSPPRLTFITLGGEGSDAWNQVPGVTAQYEQAVARSLDPLVWIWRQVRYPLDNPNTMGGEPRRGLCDRQGQRHRRHQRHQGKFALGGYSAGAAVMSLVYDEIRSGSSDPPPPRPGGRHHVRQPGPRGGPQHPRWHRPDRARGARRRVPAGRYRGAVVGLRHRRRAPRSLRHHRQTPAPGATSPSSTRPRWATGPPPRPS